MCIEVKVQPVQQYLDVHGGKRAGTAGQARAPSERLRFM